MVAMKRIWLPVATFVSYNPANNRFRLTCTTNRELDKYHRAKLATVDA